jgi:hypothetical protein
MLHASWSDEPSWRKQDASNNSLKLKVQGEEEVTSPEKKKKTQKRVMRRRRGECLIWERKWKYKRREPQQPCPVM